MLDTLQTPVTDPPIDTPDATRVPIGRHATGALELDLGAGFTVLTGETGAGKSILIDALQHLVCGQFVHADVHQHGANADADGKVNGGTRRADLERLVADTLSQAFGHLNGHVHIDVGQDDDKFLAA